MRLFSCDRCGETLAFDTPVCGRCGAAVGYRPGRGAFGLVGHDGEPPFRCSNADAGGCNWLVERGSETFCAGCRHNRLIPNLALPGALARWRKLEAAKRRLIYALLRLGIALPNLVDDPVNGLVFDFLDDEPDRAVVTGHADGTITIAAREADDAAREDMRDRMGETYRTVLGHFRHEIGHWIWLRLVRDGEQLDAFRAVFGDERADYKAALARHYRQGPPSDWARRGITPYASAHPWEDFAEIWAHYLHMIDTLETASFFALAVRSHRIDFDPYREGSIEQLLTGWDGLVEAMNEINRSMGLADLYPFSIGEAARAKLAFVHRLRGG